jgi:hypothetical protein
VFLQTYPTPEAAQSASVEEMTSVLKAAGHTNPSKVAPHIWQALHRTQLKADAITTRTRVAAYAGSRWTITATGRTDQRV